MAITETKFDVVSSGQSYSVPGEWTGFESSFVDEGSVRTITFRPKTGTKG
jgi:hypothetical protein